MIDVSDGFGVNQSAEEVIWLDPRVQNHLTDTANAERFVKGYKHKIRYARKMGKWIGYDGTRWCFELGEDMAKCCYLQTARKLYNGVAGATGLENKQALLRGAFYAESARGMRGALSIAQSFPEISVSVNDFDTDPYLLNCLNGTINLRSGELQPHNPADMISKLAPVLYDPKATLPLWNDVIQMATKGDESLRDFLQVAAGYSITGDTSEERTFFLFGPTASQKTTVLEPIKRLLGDYAMTSAFDTFIKRKSDVGSPRNDVARLCGARFVTCSEIDEGKELDENLFKQASGRNTISARFLFKEAFDFQPQFKLWMEANASPKIRDTGDGSMWRRMLRIPFDNTIPIEKQDKSVKSTLLNLEISGSAILTWLVQGCLRWQKEGLNVPSAVVQSTAEYRDSQEDLRDFFEDACIFAPDSFVSVSTLRSAYEKWAKDNGVKHTLGSYRFNKKLEERGCKREVKRIKLTTGKSFLEKCWVGIKTW